MSRVSLDQYQIPLRSLGRGGRRKPARTYSSSSNSRNGDFGGSFTELANDDDDRLSADEAPLIIKNGVCLDSICDWLNSMAILALTHLLKPFKAFLGFILKRTHPSLVISFLENVFFYNMSSDIQANLNSILAILFRMLSTMLSPSFPSLSIKKFVTLSRNTDD